MVTAAADARPRLLPRIALPRAQVFRRRLRVRRTPSMLQMEAVECGAASLGMVLAYHGRWVPLEELRLACGVSRDGSKASNILHAARRYGLAGKGFRKEPEELGTLPLPAIIHWNFNHFVVCEGLRRGWAYINDPAIGRYRVTPLEFSEAFTGVVLAFEPTAEFRRAGAPPRAIPALWRQLAGSRAGLALIVLLSLCLVLPGIVVPVFSKLFVDDVLIGRLPGWIAPLLTGLALTAALRALILGLRMRHLLRLEVKLGLAMSSRFFWHMLHLPIAFFTQRHAGDLASRVAVNEQVAKLLSGELATTVLDLVTLAFYAGAMVAYDLTLAGLAVPLALVNLAVLRVVGRSREDAARRLAKDQSQLAAATVGTIRSIESIKATGLEERAFARWAGFQAKAMSAEQDLDRQTTTLGVVPPLLAALGNAAVLGLGSFRVIHGAMSVGDLVAFQTLAASFSAPITRLVGLGASLQQIKAGIAQIDDVFANPVALAGRPRIAAGWDAGRLAGMVELRALSFGYNPNEPLLIEDFSLLVRPGQRVALVGRSGSGKSTVGRLICGLYPPWSGQILLDGRPLADIPPEVLANSLAYVDQDITLFGASLRDNIALWDDSIDDGRIARALQDAAIFDEIAARPGVYGYRVAEGGLDFSGGQRQRLEIARALVTEPAILVLDEATDALDPVVEKQIDDGIRRRGCTCVIIAHRLSTIRDCDEIIVLSSGRIVGRGTHAQLVANCPEYLDLLEGE